MNDTAIRVCRVALGVMFLAAALAKIGDPATFAKQIHNFELLPVALENVTAVLLPWIELVAGLALVCAINGRPAAVLCTALLALFTVAVFSAVLRGLVIDCGCFGTADPEPVGWLKLLQNAGMLVIALVGCARRRG